MNKHVLVTGIGGNVGQGILRNIVALKYPITLIGTNVVYVSAGNYLCDRVYEVPYGDEPSYIEVIRHISQKEHVDLIIPSTDAEAYYLAKAVNTIPIISSSPLEVAYIFYDKYETYSAFKKYHIPFADSYLPSHYTGKFKECVVKPRKGRGSRNIHINPSEPSAFDDSYVIQRLFRGVEITTAFYVTKTRNVLGSITFVRELSHGLTIRCEVTTRYDDKINRIINAMVKHFNIKGSCNIQSIVDQDTGDIIPFEINGRISGTNSIRSHFGFEDVRYTIEELLYNKVPRAPTVKIGSALRMVTDIIYPGSMLSQISNNTDTFYLS